VSGESYFNRIVDPRTYDQVSRDIIRRSAYPFVVDSKIHIDSGKANYSFNPVNKYFGAGVERDFSC
jgi:hypothetical protein